MRVAVVVHDEGLRRVLAEVASRAHAEVDYGQPTPEGVAELARTRPDVLLVEARPDLDLERLRETARAHDSALLLACHQPEDCPSASVADADDWFLLPVQPRELELRLHTARQRARAAALPNGTEDAARVVRYRELLYDRPTGLPTLPIMIGKARELIDTRGHLTILYIHFVWYSKVEEIYGWQRLDEVLETTAHAIREFFERERIDAEYLLVAHIADDDFILFVQLPTTAEQAEQRLKALSARLENFLRERIEEAQGEEIAALGSIYVGTATVFRNPKIRTERLIYRAIREAAHAARGAMEWERIRKINDLKATLRDEAIFIEYFPIVVTETEQIYGYEALARGTRRELRSPQVLFDVAEEANLIWELTRLLRRRAVDGIYRSLAPDQYLFLNVDPHEFDDPTFRNLNPKDLGIEGPNRIVLEITERTAIKDYARFQEYLAAFRERGFRFAVDDAGSGYAGLGSIANLNPDYIKLDMMLISNVDTNFLKQNLVETLVNFAESQGAMVIAEGIERREEFETVRELGVHLTQGFLFYRPQFVGTPEPGTTD